MNVESDLYDIKNWNLKPERYIRYTENLGNKLKDKSKKTDQTSWVEVNVSVADLYALFYVSLGLRPNGFYTHVIQGMPIDNLIWWDFLIESKYGFIHVWRTNSRLECHYEVDDGSFNVDEFFKVNIKKHKLAISQYIDTVLEKHNLSINHYKSYLQSIESLWIEFEAIEVVEPKPIAFSVTEAEFKTWQEDINKFNKSIVKRHVVGKSLILFSAFAAESLLNNIIRVIMTPLLQNRKRIIEAALKQTFKDKLENLDYYCRPYVHKINLGDKVIQDTLKLIELRNKYVHADESSEFNKRGQVLFDKDFPVFEVEHKSNIVTGMLKSFGEPNPDRIRNAHDTIQKFSTFIQSHIHEKLRTELWHLLDADPIGFNTKNNRYSAIFPKSMVSFAGIYEKKK